jgi:hypothetical protein
LKNKCALSSKTDGANGLKDSRLFIFLLIKSLILGLPGLAKIDLLPNALGPFSERPWNQPIILFSNINLAV